MNFQLVIDSLTKILTDIVTFIPNLINGVIILLVGVTVARLVRFSLRFVLDRLRFDALVERTGIAGTLRSVGVKMPMSQILAQIIFALLLISFLISSTRLMGLEAVARLLEQLIVFLPHFIAAGIIFVLGNMAAQFAGSLISSTLAASGIANGERVGRLVQYLVSLFVLILALSQLGVDTALLVTALTITIAAFGLALGLALGLGARGVVGHILAGFYLRQRFLVGERISLGEVQGAVRQVGPVNTELGDAQRRVVIPNSTLLESIVRGQSDGDEAEG